MAHRERAYARLGDHRAGPDHTAWLTRQAKTGVPIYCGCCGNFMIGFFQAPDRLVLFSKSHGQWHTLTLDHMNLRVDLTDTLHASH
jgi:hypothetical protein